MIKEGEEFGISKPFLVLEPHLVYFVALLYWEGCGLKISFRLFSEWEGMTEARGLCEIVLFAVFCVIIMVHVQVSSIGRKCMYIEGVRPDSIYSYKLHLVLETIVV